MIDNRDKRLGLAVSAIEWIADRRTPFRAGELAEDLEVSRRTAHRYLCCLEASGFVACDRPANPSGLWVWSRGERLEHLVVGSAA